MDPPAVRARGDHQDGDSMIRGIIALGYSSLAMTIGLLPPTVFCTGIGGVYRIPPGGRVSPKMPLVANVTSGTFNLRVDFNFIEALPSLGAKLRVE